MNTTPATTPMNSSTSTNIFSGPKLPLGLPNSHVPLLMSSPTAPGMPDKIPAMMSKLITLPMPNSSICSPSHMRKTVPEVMVMTVTKIHHQETVFVDGSL